MQDASCPMVQLTGNQYRLLVAVRYLNASDELFKGLKQLQGGNDFHFVVTMRSFIEYTRRGIWFLVWAKDARLEVAEKLTFDRSGIPNISDIYKIINTALGNGSISHLLTPIPPINNEPFINALHALTHGNPISVRMFGFGLSKMFKTDKLLQRAELELDWFRMLLYRRILGDEFAAIWKLIAPIQNDPVAMRKLVLEAAKSVKDAGLAATPQVFQNSKVTSLVNGPVPSRGGAERNYAGESWWRRDDFIFGIKLETEATVELEAKEGDDHDADRDPAV